MSTPRLAPPRVPSGKITVQAPPELAPSDGGGGMLASLVPMLGSVGAIVMVRGPRASSRVACSCCRRSASSP